MNELALFAGAGGGILGGHLLGWRTRCAVEVDSYARGVLLARQRDGLLPDFPIWDDVRTFDGIPWRGHVDVVSGGFPCQDVSKNGSGSGLEGKRSGLWREMARIIGEVRPRFAFVENSPMLTSRGLGRVLGDLAEMGFDARWGCISAAQTGAPHQRERIWICAWAGEEANAFRADAYRERPHTAEMHQRAFQPGDEQGGELEQAAWWGAEPGLERVADGVANQVDRLRAIGNGQVPLVAAAAWRILTHNAEVTGA